MISPSDRAVLAAALQDATPETLREDAAWAAAEAGFTDEYGDRAAVPRWRRFAALALAVATMEEQGLGVTIPDDEEPYNRDVYMRYDFTTVAEAPTLMSALAALLKGDQ